MLKSMTVFAPFCVAAALVAGQACAEEPKPLKLFDDKRAITVETEDGPVEITRFKKDCAPVAGTIQPMVPVEGVTPAGEIDVFAAMGDSDTLLVDMREEHWYIDQTIPSAVNIPFTEVASRLDELGCAKAGATWDCANAKKVMAFCNGPMCGQSPQAMREMVAAGFPMTKVYYYRGGMMAWNALGLTTQDGAF